MFWTQYSLELSIYGTQDLWVMSGFGVGRTCGGLPGGAWSSNLLSSTFPVSNRIDLDLVLHGIVAS